MSAAAPRRIALYWRLVRLHRPIGILLLLWPTLWGLFIASRGEPDPYPLLAFLLGTVLMRSAGCAINDWADRDFDRHVARTRDRPLTAGLIRPWEALAVAAALSLPALLLVLPFNPLTWLLTGVAGFLAASYPFTKRFLAIPQAYLGIAFGFGIPMAFAAVTDSVPLTAWLLLAANICWAVAYDTEYAMVDRDDDLRIGIRTAAITFGEGRYASERSREGAPPVAHEAEDQPWPGLVHWGPSRTRFRVTDEGGSETVLTFTRSGIFAWKLSHIGLPEGGSPEGAGEPAEGPPQAG